MFQNKAIILLFLAVFSINFSYSKPAEAYFLQGTIEYFENLLWGSSEEPVPQGNSEPSEFQEHKEEIFEGLMPSSEQTIAEEIRNSLERTGTLPEGINIKGKKTDEKTGAIYWAINDERGETNTNVTIEVDNDGLITLPEGSFKSDGSSTLNQKLYNDILENNEASEEEVDSLNNQFHDFLDNKVGTLADALGVDSETAAGTFMSGLSAAGLILLGSGKTKEEQEEIRESIKTRTENGDINYEEHIKKYPAKAYGRIDTASEKKFINHIASENRNQPAPSQKLTLQNLDTIKKSIANLPPSSMLSDQDALFQIKREIANTTGLWQGDDIDKLAGQIVRTANKYNINPFVLCAQLKQESGFNPTVVSDVGALGIAQFMPDTAKDYNINPLNVEESIDAQGRYMRSEMDEFGDYALALAAYNAGRKPVKDYAGVPPYPETQDYVKKILETASELASSYYASKR